MSTAVLAKQSKNQFQITLTIPLDEVNKTLDEVLIEAAKSVEIPGFRKGHVPPAKAKEHLDMSKLYEHVLQHLLPTHYLNALKEHKLKPIIDPKFELLETSPDKDWQVRAISTEAPEVHLHDYKQKIKGFLKVEQIWTPEKDGDKQPEPKDNKSDKENINNINQQISKILEQVLKEVEVDPADILVETQANRLLSQFVDQVNKLGMTVEQYAQASGKTLQDIKADYAKRAREELKLEFILLAIAEAEKINASDEEIQKFINTAPDDKTKSQLQTPEQKSYLALMLQRQKVMDYLIKLAS